jgi:hypothetical protein
MAPPAPAPSRFSGVRGFRAEQIAVSRHLPPGHVGLRSAGSPLGVGAARRLMPDHVVRTVTELHHHLGYPLADWASAGFPAATFGAGCASRPKTEAGKSPSSSVQPSWKLRDLRPKLGHQRRQPPPASQSAPQVCDPLRQQPFSRAFAAGSPAASSPTPGISDTRASSRS